VPEVGCFVGAPSVDRPVCVARQLSCAACRRGGADGVLIGGNPSLDGAVLLKALRARLGRHVTIMAGDGFEDIPRC
jgi:hypothetical protein